jgi:hypothetical protein
MVVCIKSPPNANIDVIKPIIINTIVKVECTSVLENHIQVLI